MCSSHSFMDGGVSDKPESRYRTHNDGDKVEDRKVASNRRGVLLINLGTPDRCDVPSVRRYLAEFLSDPEVIRLPAGFGWLNGVLGRTIARFRAPKSREMYARIWTDRGSPLRTNTEDQTAALQEALPGWRVFYAMRYGRPSISTTLRDVETAGVEALVIVPMYPQFSGPTTGTALQHVYEYLKGDGKHFQVTIRTSWYDDFGYIKAQSELIEQYARSKGLTPDNTHLLFSAHGLPVSYVKRGDPYPEHMARTVELVRQRLNWPGDRMSLAFQSLLGPVRWLKPFTDEVLVSLARTGEKQVLVCPISFTADCLETLEELDIRYRALLDGSGMDLHLCPAPNTFGPFISALKHLVLRGPRPIPSRRELPARSTTPHERGGYHPDHFVPGDRDLESLVMIGVSVRGRLCTGRGPELTHANADGLRRVKRSQCDVPKLLRTIQARTDIREPWLWNTCHRFELYGWLGVPEEVCADTVAQIKKHLFQNSPDGARRDNRVGAETPVWRFVAKQVEDAVPLEVNVLHGADAWHHLLRTAVGLNSALPGERDVLEQFQAAHRLADRAGTAGPLARRLVDNVSAFTRELRRATAWGRYDPDYAYAALSRIGIPKQLEFPRCRVVVIGGSTTSAGVLRALRDRFNVPAGQLTLLYRGHKHGGHLKILRKAIGGGRRIRVQSYADPRVFEAVADADVVIFGVDREEPVLNADRIRRFRDWTARKLTVCDFNMFGSTSGLKSIEGVTLYDARRLEAEAKVFADDMCASEEFSHAVHEAESWIVDSALTPDISRKDGMILSAAHADVIREPKNPGWTPAFEVDAGAEVPF